MKMHGRGQGQGLQRWQGAGRTVKQYPCMESGHLAFDSVDGSDIRLTS